MSCIEALFNHVRSNEEGEKSRLSDAEIPDDEIKGFILFIFQKRGPRVSMNNKKAELRMLLGFRTRFCIWPATA